MSPILHSKTEKHLGNQRIEVGVPWFVDAYLLYGLLPLDGGGVRRSVESWELRSLGFRDAPNRPAFSGKVDVFGFRLVLKFEGVIF